MSFQLWAEDRRLKGLVLIVLLLGAVALGAYTYVTLKQAKYMYGGLTSISVDGMGEAVAVPDIATFSFSVRAEAADAASAQNQSAERINPILEALEEAGIADEDIKTASYDLYPEYDYIQGACIEGRCPPGRQELRGYSVTQRVEVKVRETEAVGDLISRVGELGATNISGLSFTIDDEDALKQEAREKAIANAREKAEQIARSLGGRLGRVMGFWEDQGLTPYYGYGGEESFDASVGRATVAPELPTGENTVTIRVNVTYEIK